MAGYTPHLTAQAADSMDGNTIGRWKLNNSYENIRMDSLVSVSAQNESKDGKGEVRIRVTERKAEWDTEKGWEKRFIGLTLIKSIQV